MKYFFKSLKKLRKISLTENEKLYGKESLLHFMEKNPVRDSEHARRQLLKRGSLFNGLQLIPQTRPMAIVVAIALIFSLGGGASVAANDALPGEALYPVKVNVNERVEGFMAFNEEAKAEFDLEKVETRLTEAEKLAEKNEADDEKITKVEARLEGHIERLEERAAKFEEKGNEAKAEELRARLEAMLEVHTQVLTSLQDYIEQLNEDLGPDAEIEGEVEIKGNGNGLGRLIANIKLKAEATDDDEDDENEEQEEENENEEEDEDEDNEEENEDEEEDDENEGPSREAALNARALVEKRMEMTLRFAERMGAKVGAEITEDAQAHLDNAEELYSEGKAQIEAESYGEAFASFRAAHKEIQRAHSQITSSIGLGNKFKVDDDGEEDGDGDDDGDGEEDEEQEEEEGENDEGSEEENNDENEGEEEGDDEEQESSEDNTTNTEASVQTEVNSPFARAWTSAKAKIGF